MEGCCEKKIKSIQNSGMLSENLTQPLRSCVELKVLPKTIKKNVLVNQYLAQLLVPFSTVWDLFMLFMVKLHLLGVKCTIELLYVSRPGGQVCEELYPQGLPDTEEPSGQAQAWGSLCGMAPECCRWRVCFPYQIDPDIQSDPAGLLLLSCWDLVDGYRSHICGTHLWLF